MSSIAARCNGEFLVAGFGICVVAGSFAPNGASAIDNTQNKGKLFSVALSATGLFTITLDNSALSAISLQATPQFNSATASDLQYRAVDVQVNRTIQLANSPVGSDTNIAANANNRVHFVLYLATSQLCK